MQIVVLGLGRFGRLWADCVSHLGRVYGYDPAIIAPRDAKEHSGPKAIQGSAQDSSEDFAGEFAPDFTLLLGRNARDEAVQSCDALFFCVPISLLPNALADLQEPLAKRLAARRARALWLMDTCSVKVKPLAQLEEAVRKLERGQTSEGKGEGQGQTSEGEGEEQGCENPFHVLGLHPMFGPDSATGRQFAGQRLVLCPGNTHRVADNIAHPIEQGRHKYYERELLLWQKRFAALGLRTICMSADEHDREAACTQGLTHFLGRVLDAFGVAESPIATAGYEALCRLQEQTCHDTWQLFLDLQRQNGYTPAMRERLQAAFESICAVLEHDSRR